jgi:hypothetical protein
MDLSIRILGMIGTFLAGLASVLLASSIGVTFKKNVPNLPKEPGTCWKAFRFKTLECTQRFTYILLGFGFFLILVSQILSFINN